MKSKSSIIINVDSNNIAEIKEYLIDNGWKIKPGLLDNVGEEPITIFCSSMTGNAVPYNSKISDDLNIIDCRGEDLIAALMYHKIGLTKDIFDDIFIPTFYKETAFIKCSTKDLINYLTKIGYTYSGIGDPDLGCIATTNLPGLEANSRRFSFIREENFYDTNPHNTWNCAGRIDCGTNIELFKAIVALSDNSTINQWFITKDGDWIYQPIISNFSGLSSELRKATVKELIEHFKNEEIRDK